MSIVLSVLSDPGIPLKDRQDALKRALSDPGIPSPTTTSSFWLKDPHPALSKRQSPALPSETDIVIIGSGITGASIVRTLLQASSSKSNPKSSNARPEIVMLEARDVCSGATGRNGGHILETVEEFSEYEATVGLDATKKITRFRLAHLAEITQAAEEYGLVDEAQVRRVQFLSAYFDEGKWAETMPCIRRFKECMPEEAAEWKIYERGDIPEDFHLSQAAGVIAGPAGAIWPYKFVTGVLNRLQQDYPGKLSIETHTPVTRVEENDSDLRYTVHTARGPIRARHIIHCTNAHVGHLVPGLRGRIFPIRGQMSAQNPGHKFVCQGREHSWIFNYERGFDYLTQLPGSSPTCAKMMFGGGFAHGRSGGVSALGVSTDNELDLYADVHLSGALSAIFGRENWGSVAGQAVEQMWSGNMGFSADMSPWVGRLPVSATGRGKREEHKGGAEWTAAAFGGEGMVQTWLSGKALATMLLRWERGDDAVGDLSWFPEQLLVTEERLRRAVLPESVERDSRL